MQKYYVQLRHAYPTPNVLEAGEPYLEYYCASEVDAQAAEGTLTANAQRDAVIAELEKRVFAAESAMLLRHDKALAAYMARYPIPMARPVS